MTYVVEMRHDSTAEADYKTCATLDYAADVVEEFMKSYDFEIRDGKPYDGGNEDGKGGGYTVFEGVKYHNNRVMGFSHAGGDGPCVRVVSSD